MTTGRINQVTIVHRHRQRSGSAPAAPRGSGVVTGGTRGRSPAVQSRAAPGRKHRQSADSIIHLPPQSSSRCGPPQFGAGPARATCRLGHARLERRMPAACHAPEGGYRLRRAPECLVFSVRHRPTIHRLPRRRRGVPAGLRAPFTWRRRCYPRGPTWHLQTYGDPTPPGSELAPSMNMDRC